MGWLGGLLFLVGAIDVISALKSDDHFTLKLIGFTSGTVLIVGAFIIWWL